MNAEYLSLTRAFQLAANGGNKTIPFETGTPYRHLVMWTKLSGTGSINVDFQPILGNTDEGSAVNITDTDFQKVFQSPTDEIRPPSRGVVKHPDDAMVVQSSLWEVLVTNQDPTDPVTVNLYIMAAASPGGS